MAARDKQLSLWEQLPKAEQERVKRELVGRKDNGAGQPSGKAGKGFQLKGYVRCELSSADKEAFREWEGSHTAEECYGQLVKLSDSGYILKIGESGQGSQASICASSTSQSWDGYVLTAHAGHAVRAAMLLVYKHMVLMQSDWSQWLVEDGEDFMR